MTEAYDTTSLERRPTASTGSLRSEQRAGSEPRDAIPSASSAISPGLDCDRCSRSATPSLLLPFIGAIYGEEEKAQKLALTGDALLEHRRRFIRPIADDFERWLDAVEPTLLPSEPLMTAVRYYKNHRDALFRFIDDPDVPIDNSPTERDFQNVAKLRLNMLFAGSTEGAHRACGLLGIVATCRPIGAPIQAYLAWAFERLGTRRYVFALEIDQLTPAAFKKSVG